jgi:hypothetical protein
MDDDSDIKKALLAKRAIHEIELKKTDSILASPGGKSRPGPKPEKSGAR